MTINLNPALRRVLYVLTALGTPVVAYLVQKDILDQDFSVLWSAEVAVVGSMAAFNVNTSTPSREDENTHIGDENQPISLKK